MIASIAEGVLWVLDACFSTADVISWFKGKPNRVERREAKAAGEAPPPRDKWNRWVIGLTLGIGITTILLIILRSARR